MSERKRIIALLRWYRTPSSGVIDLPAIEVSKPIIDELSFRLASLDSDSKINAKLSGSAKISFFGVDRDLYHLTHEISPESILRKEAAERGRLTVEKRRAEKQSEAHD